MSEFEHITTSNLARIRAAQTIIGQLIPDFGVSKEELREVASKLGAIADRIAKDIQVEEEGVK